MEKIEYEKNVLNQLVKAREAVKKKYNLLKSQKENVERAIEDTFKPIVGPLEKLVEQNKTKNRVAAEAAAAAAIDEKKQISLLNDYDTFQLNDSIFSDQNNSTLQAADTSAFESADDDNDFKYYNPMLLKESELDKVYGVRKENGKYRIGNSLINFENSSITVNDKSYNNTEGLLELLFKKHPNENLITRADTMSYKEILEVSNAHKLRHRPDERIRASSSKKYIKIIKPMFKKSTGSGIRLPRYKIAKLNTRTDYVYWDDPNELVDRLQLLIAERTAGNPSHENEIQSIIEELREGGYIY